MIVIDSEDEDDYDDSLTGFMRHVSTTSNNLFFLRWFVTRASFPLKRTFLEVEIFPVLKQ